MRRSICLLAVLCAFGSGCSRDWDSLRARATAGEGDAGDPGWVEPPDTMQNVAPAEPQPSNPTPATPPGSGAVPADPPMPAAMTPARDAGGPISEPAEPPDLDAGQAKPDTGPPDTGSTVQQYAVQVVLSGDGSGSVVSEEPGIDCGDTCEAMFPAGTQLTLSADVSSGSFAGWSGDCQGSESNCVVTVDRDLSIGAGFDLVQRSLMVSVQGNGGGRVYTDDGSLDCPSQCLASFPEGSEVTLRFEADGTSTFGGWGGIAGCGATGGCTVRMDQARSATASFARMTRTLTVTMYGNTQGFFNSTPTGLSCSIDCSQDSMQVPIGDQVTVSVTPHVGFRVGSWTGANCAARSRECTIIMGASGLDLGIQMERDCEVAECNGACVDTNTDLNHCGQCGRACGNASQWSCQQGDCVAAQADQQCLNAAATSALDSACAQCLCNTNASAGCLNEVNTCEGSSSGRCGDLFACEYQAPCDGDCCLCGGVCDQALGSNIGQGACSEEIAAAVGIAYPINLLEASSITPACDTAEGSTSCASSRRLTQCMRNRCGDVCALPPLCQ